MVRQEHELDGTPVEELILAELDHALSPREERALTDHVQACVSCRELRLQHQRLHQRIGVPVEAKIVSRERPRIWERIEAARRIAPRRTPLVVLSAVAAVLVLGLGIAVALLAGRAQVGVLAPANEEVVRLSFERPDGLAGTLAVEQGPAVARPGEGTGVAARAEIAFPRKVAAGTAEIRSQAEGEPSYHTLASVGLATTTRASARGTLPRPEGTEPVVYRLWVHIETDEGTFDTQPLVIDLIPLKSGERARPH